MVSRGPANSLTFLKREPPDPLTFAGPCKSVYPGVIRGLSFVPWSGPGSTPGRNVETQVSGFQPDPVGVLRYNSRDPMAAAPIHRLREICLALPKASRAGSWGEPTFRVRKRLFAMYANANNHHGDGRHAVWCKATHITQEIVVRRWPTRYFVPSYVGVSGWFGIYLDKDPDWHDVADRLRES